MKPHNTVSQVLQGIINDRSAELEATILGYRDGGDPVKTVEKIVATKRQIADLKDLLEQLENQP